MMIQKIRTNDHDEYKDHENRCNFLKLLDFLVDHDLIIIEEDLRTGNCKRLLRTYLHSGYDILF